MGLATVVRALAMTIREPSVAEIVNAVSVGT
jgi:hypothetical protein